MSRTKRSLNFTFKFPFALILASLSSHVFAQNTVPATGNVGIGNSTPASLVSVGSNTTVMDGQQASIYYGSSATSGHYGALSLQTISYATDNSTGAVYGLNSQAGTSNSSYNLSNVFAILGGTVHRGSGVLGTAIALYANRPTLTGSGTIGSSYGLFIGVQKQTNVSNGWGVYQTGSSDKNYFNGNVSIGTTDAVNKLTVLQNGSQVPNLLLQDSGSGDAGIAFNVSGVSYTWGIDQSDNKLFKLSNSTTLGTADVISIGGANKNMGIGTNPLDTYKLAVNGGIIATAVTVKLQQSWPDYVFAGTYKLPTLASLKSYILKNKRLPDMPSAEQVAENGLDLSETNRILTKRLEELTLQVISLSERLEKQEKRHRNRHYQPKK